MNYGELRDIELLLTRHSDFLLAKYLAGSRLYGLETPQSDTDLKGIFALPARFYLKIGPPLEQVSDAEHDRNFYSLKRFCELLGEGNPNFLELLFVPEEYKFFESPSLRPLLENRKRFVTRTVYTSHRNHLIGEFPRLEKLVANGPADLHIRKRFMYLLRMTWSSENLLTRGEPLVRVTGEHREHLMSLRLGETPLPTALSLLRDEFHRVEELASHHLSTLPASVDLEWVDDLVWEITENWTQKKGL